MQEDMSRGAGSAFGGNKTKSILLVLIPAVISFVLTPLIWHRPMGGMMPSPAQLPFFIILGVVESLAFGAGVLFIFKGWPLIKQVGNVSENLKCWAFFAITWSLMSWWPHDNFHQVIGHGDFQSLLYIEYSFHLTLIISAIIIASFFVSALKNRQ